MKQLTALAVDRGAEIVSFHESCIPAYTFLRGCSKAQLLELAEIVPDRPSTRKLIEMAWEFKIAILAGLLEKDDQIRNGNAMLIDRYGEIVIESNSFDDDVVVGLCTPEKIVDSPGRRYLRVRRPELYGKLTEIGPDSPVIDPGWTIRK